MPREALPCIACGRTLKNVTDDVTNHPSGGTAFRSEGHYGSTAFDPMDGSYIEINVCDDCLLTTREEGSVLWSRDRKRVVTHLPDGGDAPLLVGWCRTPGRALIPWKDADDDDEALEVDLDEVGADWLSEIEWDKTAVEYVKRALNSSEQPEAAPEQQEGPGGPRGLDHHRKAQQGHKQRPE